MTAAALLAEIFRRSDQLLAAWAVHTAVAVAVVALAVAAPAVRGDRRARRVLAGLFAFLALANLEGMLWILKQWRAVADALGTLPDRPAGDLAEVTAAPHALWVVPFHLVLDVATVWAVLTAGRPPADRPPG